MADPLSLVAIAGLAYAGKVLSEKKKTEKVNLDKKTRKALEQAAAEIVSIP